MPERMTSEMVERVAVAIYLHMRPECSVEDWRAEAEREGGRLQKAYHSCAQAAIAAALPDKEPQE